MVFRLSGRVADLGQFDGLLGFRLSSSLSSHAYHPLVMIIFFYLCLLEFLVNINHNFLYI